MSGNKEKQRPEGHWIKRQPRPSKPAAPPPRRKPGLVQAMIAGSVGIMLGMLNAAATGAVGLTTPGNTAVAAATAPTVATPENRLRRETVEVFENIEDSK